MQSKIFIKWSVIINLYSIYIMFILALLLNFNLYIMTVIVFFLIIEAIVCFSFLYVSLTSFNGYKQS